MSDDTPIIGIDLGTTNSVVAIVRGNRVEVLEEQGDPLLPSVVGLDAEGKLTVGHVARNAMAAFPDRTIASIKRRMGQADTVSLGDQTFTPQEISAMILRRLRDRAEAALGCRVERAVITVPAFFDENQRQATREAGELAGFQVARIINEPTAATLVYRGAGDELEHVLVYDLGGGTFDVSVVRLEQGVVEVLSSKGDTELGGDDFDQLLLDFVAEAFLDEHGIDLRAKATSRWRLLQACERAKCRLSDEGIVRIMEEFIAEQDGQPLNLDLEVSRVEYERLIQPLIDRTITCVDGALRDANLTLNSIDQIILVGGSTRTPLVQDRLREEFHREPSRAVDPDLAVALGAANQAGMLSGMDIGPVLVDVATHTLGIEAAEGYDFNGPRLRFSPIIHRNSPLPAKYEQPFRTMVDGQERAEIHVLQGEHRELARNRAIGRFYLPLDPTREAGSLILVRFELTIDGTLKVQAIEHATGTTETLVIDNALSRFQQEHRAEAAERLETMFQQSQQLVNEAERPAAQGGGPAGEFEATFAEPSAVEQLLQKASEVQATAGEQDAEEIGELVAKLRAALALGHEGEIEELREELDDILFYVQG